MDAAGAKHEAERGAGSIPTARLYAASADVPAGSTRALCRVLSRRDTSSEPSQWPQPQPVGQSPGSRDRSVDGASRHHSKRATIAAMTDNANTVLREALALRADERAQVAASLLASLDAEGNDDTAVETAWAVELESRARQTLEDASSGEDWERVRERIGRRLING